jgi:hypothetical protein
VGVIRSSARRACGLAVGSVLLLWGAAASADRPEEVRLVAVQVLIAHAAQEGEGVDPRCEELRKQLGPMRFKSLRVVQERRFRLRMGEHGGLALPSGTDLRIVPLSIIRKRLNLRLEVPGVVNTRLQMTSGRPVIVGGPRHRGGHLIVQIVPEY